MGADIIVTRMERVRKRHPRHIPCLFYLPDGHELKLLLPDDAKVSHAMLAVRQRMDNIGPGEALFSFVDNRICTGSTAITQLDTNKPDEIVFHVKQEATFG